MRHLPLLFLVACAASETDLEHSQRAADFDAWAQRAHVSAPTQEPPAFVWATREANAARLPDSLEAAARFHLAAHAERFRLPSTNDAVLAGIHDLGEGAIVVSFKQQVGDYEVLRNRISVVMDRDRQPVALAGHMAASTHVTPQFSLQPSEALAFAVMDLLGVELGAADAIEPELPGDYVSFDTPFAFRSPPRAKRVMFDDASALVAAYYVEIDVGDYYAYVISAQDGRLLLRKNLTADAFSYRVWADQNNMPFDSPLGEAVPNAHGAPGGPPLPHVAQKLVTLDNFPFSKNDPWLPVGATNLFGNNVQAYADLAEPPGLGVDDLVALSFTETYEPTLAADANDKQRSAAITQLFYVNNFLHDWFYDAGFDEAAGNAQLSNYERGGKEADPLLAEAQDYSGRNNANMSTPADGASPRMQMYLFTSRDGTLDNMVVAHEWGHFISNRLVGNGIGLVGNPQAGLGEGWGDFHALLLTTKESDLDRPNNARYSGAYGMATYVANSYYGMRRVPYSVDFQRNALTFKHIQNGVPLPAGVPVQFGASGVRNAEAHNTGEVWATMLWECYVALLRETLTSSPRLTFGEARERMKRYLVAAYKVTPLNPTLLEARDALLAVTYAGDVQDFVLFQQAFARRGAGLRARGPERFSEDNAGVVESYAAGNDVAIESLTLQESESACPDGIVDNGETATLTIKVKNVGAARLSNTRARVSSSTSGVSFPDGSQVSFDAMDPFVATSASVKVRLQGVSGRVRLDLAVSVDDPDLELDEPARDRLSVMANFDEKKNASTTDDVEAPHPAWVAAHDPALANADWTRDAQQPDQHVFFGASQAMPADLYLVSPPLQVTGNFEVSFKHTYSFEYDDQENIYYDGGVIELSTDGTTWTDVGTAIAGYPAKLTEEGNGPLKGRDVFSGLAPSYPTLKKKTLSFGNAYVGQTVQLRFRSASDDASLAVGWIIDDIAVSGIGNKPFTQVIAEQACQ